MFSSEMPADVHSYLQTFLSPGALFNLGCTSRCNHTLFSNPNLWQTLAKRDYGADVALTESFHAYKELKLGFEQEKKYFLWCSMAMDITVTKVRELPKCKALLEPIQRVLDQPEQSDFLEVLKQEALTRFKQSVAIAPEKTQEYYNDLAKLVTEDELSAIANNADGLFNAIFSVAFIKDVIGQSAVMRNADAADYEWDQPNLTLMQMIFYYTFEIFVILNASISVRKLLDLMQLENNSPLLQFMLILACRYPCLNVIKVLLNDVNVNQKVWIHDCGAMHVTPLAMAILAALHHKNASHAQEIIAFMLEKGADPDIFVYISDSDYPINSEERYKECSLSIKDFCQSLLEDGLQYTYDADEQVQKNIMLETLNRVVSHHHKNPEIADQAPSKKVEFN